MWPFSKRNDPVVAPISNDNVVLITAYLNKGSVVISYKGEVHTGYFDGNILRKMMKAKDDRRKHAIEEFLGGVAKLLLIFNPNAKEDKERGDSAS